MKLTDRSKGGSRKLALGLGGLALTCLGSTAAIAAGISLLYVGTKMPDSMIPTWLIRPLAALSVAAGEDISGLALVSGNVNVTQTVVTPVPTATTSTILPMRVGMNIEPSYYYVPNRIFMNLLKNDYWRIANQFPSASQRDANGNIISLAPGTYAQRSVGLAPGVFTTGTVEITCRWQGIGTVRVLNNGAAANVRYGSGTLSFTYVNSGWLNNAVLQLMAVDATNPLHDIDCRETSADPNTLFDPDYVKRHTGLDTLRFVYWMHYEVNPTVTWATRTRPESAAGYGNDGYAIEHMIAMANATHANAWFNMPWNADADYYRKFAEMVRDTLDPSLKVYVETSNEVWNGLYPVAQQAIAEGKAEGLGGTDTFRGGVERYAEKVTEVNKIWTDVFKGQESRLVRVASVQSGSPSQATIILGFRDAATYIDAIAQAPYFTVPVDGVYTADPASMSRLFTALRKNIDYQVTLGQQVKVVADKYKKRMVCYEAGQHLVVADLALAKAIQRDPRMGQLYTYYLTQWQQKNGDLMNLLQDVYTINKYGSWGLQEYGTQPINDAPKAKAVALFMRSIGQ